MSDAQLNDLPKEVILWGGTGQAKVVRPIIEHYGAKVIAVFDDTPNLARPFLDVDLFCGWDAFKKWIDSRDRKTIGFCVAIGNPHGRVRIRFQNRLIDEGLQPISIAHPTAWIAENATVGSGAQIHAGAIIGVETRIGEQCIVNTRASIDHECVLEDGVELAPGATLCGSVYAGTNSWICAGATVLPRVRLGADSVIGAGAVVIRDVPDGTTVVGVPAKPVRSRGENIR